MPVQLAKRQSTKTVSRYPTSMAMAKKVLNPIKTVHTPLPQRGNARTVKMSEKKKKRKSANLEGIGVTYQETQAIYDGGIVNGLTVNNIIAINNLKYAWSFILENEKLENDYNERNTTSYLCQSKHGK